MVTDEHDHQEGAVLVVGQLVDLAVDAGKDEVRGRRSDRQNRVSRLTLQ